MHQSIARHLPDKDITQTYPVGILQKKLVRQMLPAKFHKQIKALNQISPDYFTVIISVYVHFPDKSVRLVSRTRI